MINARKRIYGLFWIFIGSLLITFAALASNSGLETLLLGASDGSLRWGPTLFRVLLGAHSLAIIAIGIVLCFVQRDAAQAEPMMSERSSAPIGKATWLSLIGLTVVALVLRLWNLNSDLWYDEVLSLLDYFRPPFGEIVTSFASQNQHMLYSLLAHLSIQVFGETAAAVRLPSVMFGVASLWALFFLGRLLVSKTEALLAAALATFSYHHIWFSQNARGYMGLLFFSVLATWLFLSALKKDRWVLWIAYALAVSLGIWVHMTMIFIPIAHGLVYVGSLLAQHLFSLARARLDLHLSVKPFVAWVLGGTLSLQLHALALPEFLDTALHLPSPPSEWSSLWWVALESLKSLQIGFSGIAVVVFGLALMLSGFGELLRRNPVAALVMVLPAVIGGITMLLMDHYLWPRFFFFSMGFGILIAVRGAMVLPPLIFRYIRRSSDHKKLSSLHGIRFETGGVLLAGLLIAGSLLTLQKLYALPKQDFTGARNWLEKSREPGDAVVAVGLAGVAYGRYYAPAWFVAQSKEELAEVRDNHANVWVVYILPPQLKVNRTELWNVIQNDFETIEVFPGTLGGGGVYVCRERGRGQLLQSQTQQGSQPLSSLTH